MLLCARGSPSYSLLTYEEIVDLVWADTISPLLFGDFQHLQKISSKRPMATPTEAQLSRTWATTPVIGSCDQWL